METTFKCPNCSGVLSQDENIVFAVENNDRRRALIMLSTRLGEYGIKNNLPFRFDVGDKLSFFCPLCHFPLQCEQHEDLTKVEMEDEDGHFYEICFSRVVGEESTYRMYGKTVIVYGSDAGKYKHLFKDFDMQKLK